MCLNERRIRKIEFKTWQELARFVIDGGELFQRIGDKYTKINFDYQKPIDCYTKKQKTIEELIAIKPRLCRVWDDIIECKGIDVINRVTNEHYKFRGKSCGWKHAEMLTDDEIKEFLNDK